MSSLVHEIEGLAHAPRAAVVRFLEGKAFPWIEGRSATFVYEGNADEVLLRHWIFSLPSTQPFARIEGTDLWFLVMQIPEGSRVEYKLEVVHGENRRILSDPRNPNKSLDPYGSNSVVHGAGYQVPEWTFPDSEARRGKIERHTIQSDNLRDRRPLRVYTPARFHESRRYPLLIVHDGSDFLEFAELQVVLDNLIHRLEIPPMVVAMTDSPQRLTEYADDENHARFLADELVPLLEKRYPLLKSPDARALMGASFGAVASLAAAWRHPGVFGNLMLLSGSFAFTDIGEHDRGPLFDPVVEFVNSFRAAPGRPSDRVYLSCGTYESLIYYNRSMMPLLQSTGMALRYAEARDGHNWEAWRDRLREGLSWLFPGPLWLVYE